MPKNRPGRIKYVTATKACVHGDLVVENGIVGVAVKQQSPAWNAAFATVKNISIGENFALINKGIVEVPLTAIAGGAPTKGVPVYIVPASNAVTLTATAGNSPVGRVAELASERGGRSTHVRIDLDDKGDITRP